MEVLAGLEAPLGPEVSIVDHLRFDAVGAGQKLGRHYPLAAMGDDGQFGQVGEFEVGHPG